MNGVYEPIALDGQERSVSGVIDLALIRWTGIYWGLETVWLRWTTMEGLLLPTDQELAIAAQQQAEQATQQQLRQVVLNLLQQNFAVEQVAQITGLSEVQVRQWAE